MEATTEGPYRVLPGRPDGTGVVLVDRDSYEPVRVEDGGYEGELADRVAALRPGYAVTATLAWNDGVARFEALAIDTRTLYEFVDDATNLFEAAVSTWEAARRAGEGVNSRLTHSTDGEPNGVVYTFARQRGEVDVFGEFRDGSRPLEPLVERTGEGESVDGAGSEDRDDREGEDGDESEDGDDREGGTGDGSEDESEADGEDGTRDAAREVFVLRPAGRDFVVVYVVLRKGSMLADTVRDTYDCPRPTEVDLDGAAAGDEE